MKIQKFIEIILQARPHCWFGGQQEHSDYILYQVWEVIDLLQLTQTTDAPLS